MGAFTAGRRVVLTLFLLLTAVSAAAGQTDVAPPDPPAPVGSILGHVSMPEETGPAESAEALLMSPEWALQWRGDVQRRLDAYSQTYRRAIERDPAIFRNISLAAYREATAYVLAEMQRILGDGFRSWVETISPEGRFEYENVPAGDYNIVVLARSGNRNLIWTGTVSVTGPVPEFVEMQNRIQ